MVSHIHQLEDRGNLNEALVESKRFAETVEKFYGPAHVATAFAKREFAEAYMLRSDFGHPVELLRESLQVFSSGPQIFESQVALTRMDLGRCYAQIGQLAEAERLDGEALDYLLKTAMQRMHRRYGPISRVSSLVKENSKTPFR